MDKNTFALKLVKEIKITRLKSIKLFYDKSLNIYLMEDQVIDDSEVFKAEKFFGQELVIKMENISNQYKLELH